MSSGPPTLRVKDFPLVPSGRTPGLFTPLPHWPGPHPPPNACWARPAAPSSHWTRLHCAPDWSPAYLHMTALLITLLQILTRFLTAKASAKPLPIDAALHRAGHHHCMASLCATARFLPPPSPARSATAACTEALPPRVVHRRACGVGGGYLCAAGREECARPAISLRHVPVPPSPGL